VVQAGGGKKGIYDGGKKSLYKTEVEEKIPTERSEKRWQSTHELFPTLRTGKGGDHVRKAGEKEKGEGKKNHFPSSLVDY